MKRIIGRFSLRPSSDSITYQFSCGGPSGDPISIFAKRSALVLLLLSVCITFSAQSSPATSSKKIVFIRYNLNPASISAVINQFKATMAEKGYIEGRNIEYVDILTHSPGRDSVLEILEATDKHRNSADMFITTSWVSLYTRSKLVQSHTPQLFVPVLKSVALNMLPAVDQEPGTNLSGLYLNYPPEKILRLARLILPGIKNYGYVYDSSIPADLIFKAEFNKLSSNERHGIYIHFIDLGQGIDNALLELKNKHIEAFGGVVGVFKNRVALDRSGLPIITSILLDIDQESLIGFVRDSNMIAGLFNSFEYCGEQAAEMTVDIFSGKKSIEEMVPRPARQAAFVNLKSADRLQVPIPFTALEAVDFVIK